jgi:hypothetical protein
MKRMMGGSESPHYKPWALGAHHIMHYGRPKEVGPVTIDAQMPVGRSFKLRQKSIVIIKPCHYRQDQISYRKQRQTPELNRTQGRTPSLLPCLARSYIAFPFRVLGIEKILYDVAFHTLVHTKQGFRRRS